MKNILVPTDFSACATYAVEAAFLLAEQFDAKLHFFTCLNIPINWSDYSVEKQNTYPEAQQRVENATQLLQKFKFKAEWNGIGVATIIRGGEFIKSLEEAVLSTKADFVVMGSHGASGKQEFFMGSNTQKAVRKLHVPILIVKNPIKKLNFKEVIYASSFNTEDKPSFQQFLNFIKWFKPETIHLLSINTIGWFSQPSNIMKAAMEDFKALAPDLNCKAHFHRAFSVDAGVRDFAEEIAADLIVVSNQHRHPIKRIFQGSSVEALVNHADTPVLSIDFQKVGKVNVEGAVFSEETE